MPRRPHRAAADTWKQLELKFSWREQHSYELIRPVVLFGDSAEARALETGEPIRTLYRHLQRFQAEGFAGLTAAAHPSAHRTVPPAVRSLILELKGEYPPLNPNELARICYARLEYRPGARTIQRILAETPPVPPVTRRYPLFHEMTPPNRRLAIIRLAMEGWGKQSIAGYLHTSRKTVHQILQRWEQEEFAALIPKSRAPRKRLRKVTLKVMLRVRALQKNRRLGAFRIYAALKQEGIRLSPRTCGRILALNRAAACQGPAAHQKHEACAMPFKATRRHQFWSADIRYLDMHGLGGGMIYCITILENYSRAVLASAITRSQDLTAFLFVLFLAVRNHGAPEALVTDGGSIFRAKQAHVIYQALGIVKVQIDQGQAWQNYIETMFNVQRRMADYAFEQATTWEALLAAHATWVADYNYQEHFAHQHRDDTKRSPAHVLSGIRGKIYGAAELHYLFHALRVRRHLDRHGYLRFRHWRIYAEAGLARDGVDVWLYDEHLTIVFEDVTLAKYNVSYQPDGRRLKTIGDPQLYQTPHQSPQLPLWVLTDDEWRKAYRLPLYAVRRRPHADRQVVQEPLPLDLGLAG